MTYASLLIRETATALAINAVLGGVVTWLSVPENSMPLVGGPQSAGFGLFMAGLLFPAAAMFIVPRVVERRLGRNETDCTGPRRAPWTTTSRLAMASILVGLCLFVIAPVYLILMHAFGGPVWGRAGAWLMNMGYLLFITLLVIPVAVEFALKKRMLSSRAALC